MRELIPGEQGQRSTRRLRDTRPVTPELEWPTWGSGRHGAPSRALREPQAFRAQPCAKPHDDHRPPITTHTRTDGDAPSRGPMQTLVPHARLYV